MFNRKQVAVLVAEFLGTGVLALVMLAVQNSPLGLPYFVALSVGLALAALMVMFNGNGGNHFNPALTIGLWTIRQIATVRALAYIVVQMLGAWAAYNLFNYFYAYSTKGTIQAVGGSYDGHILVAEAVGALILSLAFAATIFRRYTNAKSAAVVGASMIMAMLVASTVYNTTVSRMNGFANPALALSTRALDFGGSTGWTMYALGPILGAVIGFNLYALLFAEESSFVRVREVVSSRLSRGTRTVASKAVTVESAAPKVKVAKAAPKRAVRGTRTRKTKTSRTRK